MSLDEWSTIASVGTFIVIAATAITAVVQLRHIRRGNQLAGLQSVFATLQDASVRELINYVRHDLSARMRDPEFRAGLLETPVDRREHPELYLCDIYNHIGSFVRTGLIDEDVYLQTDWYNVSLYWTLLSDVVAHIRQSRPFVAENFEWLASRTEQWISKHPHGDYPRNQSRMLH